MLLHHFFNHIYIYNHSLSLYIHHFFSLTHTLLTHHKSFVSRISPGLIDWNFDSVIVLGYCISCNLDLLFSVMCDSGHI
ncbi:hypothetical protein QVD17_21237 [Tagetes erecta]|uniref:Uncharacterized protein n=1 Tax=Tagetes erecta TaxID=13708 RepID=A0AAD8KU88_TARER|nr:hypothetical protein QVD17_21237 [Tagetes erecta]